MTMQHGFVQLPPDGAGKKVPQSVMVEVEYVSGTTPFTVGDIVSFSVSTVVGTIVEIDVDSGTSGDIYIRLEAPIPTVVNIAPGENIIVKSLTYAQVGAVLDPFYFQNTVMVGKNMMHQVEVDEHGSVQTSFPEGSPQFDAFGKLMVSEQTTLGEYVQSYDELPGLFTTEITGGATMVYDHNTRGVLMTCGTASGDRVVRTTDEYHAYQPGYSQLIEFTGSMGDTGKANVIRRGGYYDDENGVYFEFKESVFGVGLRSNSTGSVVDTFVQQTEWNRDRIDGSGTLFNPSGKQANPMVDNIFWIDLQWLGAGQVRFGVVIDGLRIVAHEMRIPTSASYMSTGSLPFRYEQENLGVTGSSSEFRMFAGIVKTEGKIQPSIIPHSASNSASVTTVNQTPIMGIRPAQTYKTFDNRITMYPYSVEVYNSGAEPIRVSLHRGSIADDGSWVLEGTSSQEINETVTTLSGLTEDKISFMVAGASVRSFPFKTLEEGRTGLRRRADITQVIEMAFTAQLLVAGTGGIVYLTFNWDEVKD